MTSQANDSQTREFFKDNGYFGLSSDRVLFFAQGIWPGMWPDGRMILSDKGRVFMSPDGHGGIITALEKKGMLSDMQARGIKAVFYFQVDNPLVEILDPAFLGLHLQARADMSVKVCKKRDPSEGLGMVVKRDGRNAVVEYIELTDEQKEERLPDGNLRLLFGSVAIHIFSTEFLVKEASVDLPLHVANKKIPYCDEEGNVITPDSPNGYKFEKFIFDVLPDAKISINVEFLRENEFSPVKNATGNDSPEISRRDMIRKWASWFEEIGIKVPKGPDGESVYLIEIDPCFALGPEDLREQIDSGFVIDQDMFLM